jgi:hypothetical protein
MFCALALDFGGTERVKSCFHVLRSRTRFRWHRGRRVLYSCFARPDSFSAVSSVSGPFFMFCAPRIIFGGTKGVRSRFHVLRSCTRFRRYRGRRVPFSCFAFPYSFSAGSSASGPSFMFCAPGIIFGYTKGVGSHFHILCSRTCFRRCRVCRVSLSCFALMDPFSAVSSASGPFLMFCAPGLVFGVTEGVGYRFHVL